MLNKLLKDKNIILGSASPRRQQFLKDLGLDFKIELKPVEEIYPPHLQKEKVAEYLAQLKAEAFKGNLQKNDILITGDTVVCLEEEILGKPKDKAEAFKMLTKLSGKKHEVISAVCLSSSEKNMVFHDITQVFFKKLSTEEINFYVNQHQPFDKAGAYGIQEWIGQIGVEKIIGSYFTVMGMPTHLLYKNLLQFLP